MTDQEQIAEMAVLGCVRNPQAHTAEECAKCDFKHGMCNAYRHAEALYNTGYRKIPKDSVVLSKEEQEQMNNELRDKIYQACKLENQKTAEKIINYFIKEFPILKTRVIARELAKQYGVEIKE